jgi:prepilin-type processing-associated H-X9-DG protein
MKPKADIAQTDHKASAAFTLTEVLVVMGVLVILALTVLPALGRSQPNVKSALCQHNLRQLVAAWQMYSDEYDGKIVPNFHGADALAPPPAVSWASGWLDWGSYPDTTNVLRLIDARYALLAPHIHGASNLFKCPADQYLSAQQRLRGWTQRVRRYSANIYIGEGYASSGPTVHIYKQIRKTSGFLNPPPAQAWVYTEEHPDSINDPALFSPSQTSWIDWPATYHYGGAAFAFGDGHTEIHKWKGSLATGPATRVTYTLSFPPAQAGDQDIAWMSYHTPRVSSQSY